MCVQLEAEAAQLTADRARRAPRGPRSRRGGAGARGAERLSPARAADLSHHRRQGVAGLELPGRRHRARVRRRHPLRPPARLHPGRGHPLGRAARARRSWAEAKSAGRHPSRGQGLRGRSTATCSRSASTCEGRGPRADDVGAARRRRCWRTPRSPRPIPASAARGCSDGHGYEGAFILPRTRSVHPSACASPSTWPSSTAT